MNTVIAVTTVALLFAGLLWVYLAHRRKKDLEFVSFVLPTVPKPDSPLKDKAEWILDCDIAIGVSLDVRGVLSALDGDIIQANFDILKKIASTHNQLLRMGSPLRIGLPHLGQDGASCFANCASRVSRRALESRSVKPPSSRKSVASDSICRRNSRHA